MFASISFNIREILEFQSDTDLRLGGRATRYGLPNHKISDELKRCCSFWLYPPLWTSLLVATLNDIENRSIGCILLLYRLEDITGSISLLCVMTANSMQLSMFRNDSSGTSLPD